MKKCIASSRCNNSEYVLLYARTPFSALISTLPVLRSRSIVPSCHFFCRWVRRFVYRQDRCSIAAILDLRVCAWLVSVLETVYSGVYKTGRTLGLAIA